MIALVILMSGLVSHSLGQVGNQTLEAPNGTTGSVQKIPFENLTEIATFFEIKGVLMYQSFLYDYLEDLIIIGGKDALVRLDQDLKLIEKYDVPVPGDRMTKCKSTHPEEDCHNFIPVLHVFDDNDKKESLLYACGSNGFEPICFVRDPNELAGTQKAKDLPGADKAPRNPTYRGVCASWLNPDNNLLFVGVPLDEDVKMATIAVSEMSDKPTYKPQKIGGSMVMQNGEFAGTFRDRQFVFFVFSEKAVENPDNAISSRIGRLCADGDGELGLVSFTKVRLECGDYNRVHGIYYIEHEYKLFATFSKEDQGVVTSAICLYPYFNIKKAFEGSFLCRKNEKDPKSPWEVCPPRPEGAQKVKTCYGNRNAEDTRDRVLMNTTVLPFCGRPMFETKGKALFGRIAAQRQRFGHFEYKIYVGDDMMGTVWNINMGPYCNQSEVYEIWEVTRDEDRKKSLEIQSLKIIYESVYVLTCCALLKYPRFDYIPSTERSTITIDFALFSPRRYTPENPDGPDGPDGPGGSGGKQPGTRIPHPAGKSSTVKLTGSFLLTMASALKVCQVRTR